MNRPFHRIIALSLVIVIFSSFSAESFETPVTDPRELGILNKMGDAFQPIATQFGCDELAWGNIIEKGQSIVLEYIPRGGKVESWERMVTVTIFPLHEQKDKDKKYITALMSNLLKAYKNNAKVIKSNFYQIAKRSPAMFIEYTIGTGALKEHNAGIFARTSPVTVVFTQVQSRGTPLSPEDSQALHNILLGKKG